MNQSTAAPAGNGKGTAVTLSDVHVPVPAQQRGIDAAAWNALKNSVYRGASDAMILLAIDYCKARRYDPLMKPVHIVKTWDEESRSYVEGIWPGINLHRTQASRSTVHPYAGQDEPIYGPDVTKKLGASDFTFPEWCKITVYRMIGGQRVSYTGLIYFIETFASIKDGGPNRMWRKRPRGQLAKCAEAEALRKAFPEETGGEPTAEEMEDQHIGPERAKDVTPKPAASRLDALEEVIGKPNPWNTETGEVIEESVAAAGLTPEQAAAPDAEAAGAPANGAELPSASSAGTPAAEAHDVAAQMAACTDIVALKEVHFHSAAGKAWLAANPQESQAAYNANFDRIKKGANVRRPA